MKIKCKCGFRTTIVADGWPFECACGVVYERPGSVGTQADAPPPDPDFGPGTELTKILADLGAKPVTACGCKAKAAAMNRLGVDGCRREREKIVVWLAKAYHKLDWASAAQAMMAGVISAWSLKLNPLDPLGSLVDLAIERASATESPDSGS